MIQRNGHRREVLNLLGKSPIVAILGARQAGKTTLARQVASAWKGPRTVFDLENRRDLSRLGEPMLALDGLKGLVVVDEVQRMPALFPALRVLADTPGARRFLLLGSASPALVRGVSESLAGRVAYHDLPGFSLGEVGSPAFPRLWLGGGFPRAFTAKREADGARWRRDFIRSILEQDIPRLGISLPAETLRRFWAMLSHVHGQVLNSSELARAFGVSDMTVRRYLDVLVGTFLVRLLSPWHENISKRQVKSPKVYVADSGILHALLGIETREDLESHPKVGASFEGFCLSNLVARLGARPGECFFWATQAGAELDLLVVRGRTRLGFEAKRTDAPAVTPSMRIALADLKLDRLDVVHAGVGTYPLADRIRAVSIRDVFRAVEPLP